MAIRYVVIYNRIPALMAFVESNARRAVKSNADKIAARAREYAPKDTGYLASSIHAASVQTGKVAEIKVDAYYAAYPEYGTYKMAAQPYLRPALADFDEDFIYEVGIGMFKAFGGQGSWGRQEL